MTKPTARDLSTCRISFATRTLFIAGLALTGCVRDDSLGVADRHDAGPDSAGAAHADSMTGDTASPPPGPDSAAVTPDLMHPGSDSSAHVAEDAAPPHADAAPTPADTATAHADTATAHADTASAHGDGAVVAADTATHAADALSIEASSSGADAAGLDGWSLGSCRLIPSGNPIPKGDGCSSVVTHCLAGSSETCGATPIENTIAAAVAQCGIYCGNIAVGFSAGCATTIMEYTPLIALDPVTHEEALACLRGVLFSARFACVPTDGWDNLYLGSCTIP